MYIHLNDEIITIKVEFRVLYTPFGVGKKDAGGWRPQEWNIKPEIEQIAVSVTVI